MNPLIRTSFDITKHNPKIIIVAGNGAVMNGNIPLKEALFKHTSTLEAELFMRNPDCTTILASYAHLFRTRRNSHLLKFNNPDEVTNIDDDLDWLKVMWNFRNELAEEFAKPTYQIIHRDHASFVKSLISNDIGIITTNWDSALWNRSDANIIHLHGHCHFPESLILPSELSHDEDIFDLFCKIPGTEDLQKKFIPFYRGNFRSHLRSCHKNAVKWLLNADEIIFWGTAFNTYDAELLSTVKEGFFNRDRTNPIQSLKLVNPNKAHRDIIASTLGLKSPIRIDIDPERREKISGSLF